MKPEDKRLVIQDLCGRLPYEVKCRFEDAMRVIDGESSPCYDSVLSAYHLEIFIRLNDFYIKPYLRPMSSMTEEEKYDYITNVKKEKCIVELPVLPKIEAIDWLNAHHFDYRGLIPRGLALSTEVFNPYKD